MNNQIRKLRAEFLSSIKGMALGIVRHILQSEMLLRELGIVDEPVSASVVPPTQGATYWRRTDGKNVYSLLRAEKDGGAVMWSPKTNKTMIISPKTFKTKWMPVENPNQKRA